MKATRILFFAVLLTAFALPALAQKVDIFGYYTPVHATDDFNDISEIHLGRQIWRTAKA